MFIFHLMFISREEKKKSVKGAKEHRKNSKCVMWCKCAKDVKQKSVVVQLNWSESCQTKYMYLYLFRHFHWNCSWTVPNGSSSTQQNTNIYMQTEVCTSMLESQNVRYPLYFPPQIRTQYTLTRQDSTSMAKHTIHFHALLRFPLWRSNSALFHITKRCYFVKLYRRCKIIFSSVCCTEAIGWSVLILNILVFVF